MEQEKERIDKAEKDYRARQRAKELAFEPVRVEREKDVEQIIKALINDKNGKETCKVILTKDRLNVCVNTPAYWSDVAKLDCWFSRPKFDISYGAGGSNDGFTSVEIANQKANALLLLCDLVAELEKLDWQKFVGIKKFKK